MTSYGPEREADRLRVIVQTLAFAHPDMRLEDAAPIIFQIEEKTAKLESPHVAAADDFKTAVGIARWIDKPAQEDIRTLAAGGTIVGVVGSGKIAAIKQVRFHTHVGLREAKEGVEAWLAGDHLTR